MQRTLSHKLNPFFLLLTALLLIAAFYLRIDQLTRFPTGISADEAVHAVDGLQIAQSGNFPIYEDFGRPEPLYNIFLGLGGFLFGSRIFTFRLVTAFLGLLNIAAAVWAMRQCVRDQPPRTRWLAGLAAAAALTVCISHVTLSRALYRAIPQPALMFLYMGFLLRGLRSHRRRDLVLAGASLGLALYTYTAALAVPFSLIVVGLSLLIFRVQQFRHWLPKLALVSLVFLIVISPIVVRLIDQRQSVLGRAGDVNEAFTVEVLLRRMQGVIYQFSQRGDPNPQYNVAAAPLLPPYFSILFGFGLAALVLRIRHASSALIVSLLALCALPVMASNEIPHGLRIMGEFAVFPLIIGLGVVLIIWFFERVPIRFVQRAVVPVTTGVLVAMTGFNAVIAHQIYLNSWQNQFTVNVYGVKLGSIDWFFRLDQRDYGQWLAAQKGPLLVPLDDVSEATIRAWIMPVYPSVRMGSEKTPIPPETRLVVSWRLETQDLRRQERSYALLNEGTIWVLPPLSQASHTALLEGIDQAEAVQRLDGSLMGRTKPLPPSLSLAFEPIRYEGNNQPIATLGGETAILNWRGPDTFYGTAEQEVLYTLGWSAQRPLGHYYSAYLQVLTQDFKRVAGEDKLLSRWLYPSTLWQRGDVIPDSYTLRIPGNLPPGAYRLAVGMYVFVEQPLTAYAPSGEKFSGAATVGWIKVPQRDGPQMPEQAAAVDATLDNTFALRRAGAERLPDGKLRLVLEWESLVQRSPVDATIFVHLLDPAGKLVAQQDTRPWGGQYPTFIWDKGERVRTEHILDSSAADGDFTVRVGMYTFPHLERLPVTQNGANASDRVAQLGKLETLLGTTK